MVMTSDQTLRDRWTDWLATDAPRRLMPVTITAYRRQVAMFGGWMDVTLGVMRAAESTTPYRRSQYLRHLESQVQRHERQPATSNTAVAALTSFGTWLVVTGQATVNPAQSARTIREQPGPVNALDRTIVVKLLDAAHHTRDLRNALVIELLAHSGMRASEVASLQIEQLDVGLRTTWVRVLGKGQKQRASRSPNTSASSCSTIWPSGAPPVATRRPTARSSSANAAASPAARLIALWPTSWPLRG